MPRQGKYFCRAKVFKTRRLKPLQGGFVLWPMITYCKAFDATFWLIEGVQLKVESEKSKVISLKIRLCEVGRGKDVFYKSKIAAPSCLRLAMTPTLSHAISHYSLLHTKYYNLPTIIYSHYALRITHYLLSHHQFANAFRKISIYRDIAGVVYIAIANFHRRLDF
ncbi:hypothetical protein B0I21_107192 [Sphingobacterium paludis]|uniref:Uncharacterized protein n=1 Tax=Sphingobacterium paludis TaxID=1476465 RepID=A0A4R7CVJ2_9SPHI|nr:hypothetical protein B0I21_107192 [Sphingobacterium paludis]